MSLAFDEVAHAYTLDGERVMSVTQILQASGLIDFSKIPPSTLNAAKERGSAVHRACNYWLENDLDLDSFRATFPTRRRDLEQL